MDPAMAAAYCIVCQTAATCEIPPDLTPHVEYVLDMTLNSALQDNALCLCDSCRQKLEEIENIINKLRKVYTSSKDAANFHNDCNTDLASSNIVPKQKSVPDHPQSQTVPGNGTLLLTVDTADDSGADDDAIADDVNQNTNIDEDFEKPLEGVLRKTNTNYSCGCGEVYYAPRDLETHRKEKHGGGVPCRDCGETLKTPSELQAHSLLHKKDAFNCTVCGLGFHRALYLKNHQRLSKRCSKDVKGVPANQPGVTKCGCGETFNTPAELKTHRRDRHGGRFVCGKCVRTFGTYGTLTRHMFFHSDEVYECKKCSQSFKHPTYLQIHQRRFHRVHAPGTLSRARKPATQSKQRSTPRTRSKTQIEEAYDAKTDMEDQGGEDEEEVNSNINSEDENNDKKETSGNSGPPLGDVLRVEAVTEVACPVCDMTYQSEAPLLKHITAYHWQQLNDSEQYKCTICSDNLPSIHAAVNHGRGHRDKMYSCKKCDFIYARKDHLLEHSIQTHKAGGVTAVGPLKCEDCGQTETSRGLLSAHMLIEHNRFARLGGDAINPPREKPHQCSFCNMSFTSRRDLQKHTSKHTRALRDRTATPYTCPECKKPCKTSGGLDKHIRNFCPGKDGVYDDATGCLKRSFLCSLCGAMYKTRSGYEMHLSKHTGQGDYQCQLCQQRFRMKAHLTKHAAVHTRPYMCAQCGKQFSSANHLNEHQVIHSTELKFRCSICDEKFRWRLSLVRHQWRCHGIGSAPKQYRKLVMCKFCRAEVSRSQRVNHFQTHHPEMTYDDRHFKCLPRKIPGAAPELGNGGIAMNLNNAATLSGRGFVPGEPRVSMNIHGSTVQVEPIVTSNENKLLSPETQPALFTLVNAAHQVALLSTGEQYVVQAAGQSGLTPVTSGIATLPPSQELSPPQHHSLVQQIQPQPAPLPPADAQRMQGNQYPGGASSEAVNTWTHTYTMWQ